MMLGLREITLLLYRLAVLFAYFIAMHAVPVKIRISLFALQEFIPSDSFLSDPIAARKEKRGVCNV